VFRSHDRRSSLHTERDPDTQMGRSRRKNAILGGGQRRDRTADAGLFRAALYH
jgi:hypothetical protein